MSVRPILLQKDGAIKGIPGAYRTSPPPIAGPYAGSDALEDVTYYTVNSSGEAELKTVKAYPFYVDSVSGGEDASGDGTEENPWKSVNQALAQLQPILACLNLKSCCTCLVLRVKGTVDYGIIYGNIFYGYNRFIIEPYLSELVYIENITTNITNTIFKNICNTKGNINSSQFFIGCDNSIFNSCLIDYDHNVSGSFSGFVECDNGIFYRCSATIKNTIESFGVTAFNMNMNSVFFETAATAYCAGGMYLFSNNNNSTFYSCNGYVNGVSSKGIGCGFRNNLNSIYLNCNGNSLGSITCDI